MRAQWTFWCDNIVFHHFKHSFSLPFRKYGRTAVLHYRLRKKSLLIYFFNYQDSAFEHFHILFMSLSYISLWYTGVWISVSLDHCVYSHWMNIYKYQFTTGKLIVTECLRLCRVPEHGHSANTRHSACPTFAEFRPSAKKGYSALFIFAECR